MSKKYTLPEQSNEWKSFYEMWEETWKNLDHNPYSKLGEDLGLDLSELSIILEHEIYHSVNEDDENEDDENEDDENEDWQINWSIEKFASALYNDESTEFKELALFCYKGYSDYIKSYLDKHDIKLMRIDKHKGGEWGIIRFMDCFLGDLKTKDKIVSWHVRYDHEDGEFVEFNRSFVERCLKEGKMPDVPSIELPCPNLSLMKSVTPPSPWCQACNGTGGEEEVSGGHRKHCDECLGSGVSPDQKILA